VDTIIAMGETVSGGVLELIPIDEANEILQQITQARVDSMRNNANDEDNQAAWGDALYCRIISDPDLYFGQIIWELWLEEDLLPTMPSGFGDGHFHDFLRWWQGYYRFKNRYILYSYDKENDCAILDWCDTLPFSRQFYDGAGNFFDTSQVDVSILSGSYQPVGDRLDGLYNEPNEDVHRLYIEIYIQFAQPIQLDSLAMTVQIIPQHPFYLLNRWQVYENDVLIVSDPPNNSSFTGVISINNLSTSTNSLRLVFNAAMETDNNPYSTLYLNKLVFNGLGVDPWLASP
jgi:hypothetical protein